MYTFMPWWDFWRSFAPSIPVPSIYDNVRSPEQRILEICHNLKVVFEYLDSTGKTVSEMQETVEQIVSGQLDPIIAQAISDWFDENEPQVVQDIADLDARIDQIEGGHMLVFGDSYSTPDYDPFTKWPVYLADALNIESDKLHNYAKSGAGFYVTGNTLATQLTSAISDAASDSYSDAVKYVFVWAGGNDTTFVSSMTPQQYIQNYIDYLIQIANAFPKAEIYCALSGSRYKRGNFRTWEFSGHNCRWHNLYSLLYSYLTTNTIFCPATLLDIELPLLRDSGYYTAANTHPNARAQTIMANSALQQMRGNGVGVLNGSHPVVIYDGHTGGIDGNHGVDISSDSTNNADCFMGSDGRIRMRMQANYLTIPANSLKTFAFGVPEWLTPGTLANIRVSDINVYARLASNDAASVLDKVTINPFSLTPTYNDGFCDVRIRNNNTVDAHLLVNVIVEYECKTGWFGQV